MKTWENVTGHVHIKKNKELSWLNEKGRLDNIIIKRKFVRMIYKYSIPYNINLKIESKENIQDFEK